METTMMAMTTMARAEKEVKTSRSFGIFRSFWLSISRREDTEVICIEAEEEVQFRISIFQSFWAFMSRREEEGFYASSRR